MKEEFEARIELEGYERLLLRDDGEEMWISIYKIGSYAGVPVSRDKVVQLRDALNIYLGQE
jgi:hypothetical protein